LNVYAHAVPVGDSFAAEVLGRILDNARCASADSAEKLAS
jgi:hypothetical protein